MNDKSRWNALAHRMIGETSALENQLDFVLALADARDEAAFVRLMSVYPRLGLRERIDLLATIDSAHADPGYVAGWLEKLVLMRNRLAHAWVLDATTSSAHFVSIYRGRRTDLRVFDDEMARAFRMIREAGRELSTLADQVGDAVLWGHLLGFDER